MRAIWGILVGAGLTLAGVASAETRDYVPPSCLDPQRTPASWLACHAPTVRITSAERAYNRIGTPTLQPGWIFGLTARVDPELPAMYVERRPDQVAGREVRQLVYRVHFERIPLRFSRYFFEAHRNPGLVFMLTVEEASGQILFVSLVHTCGCYLAVIPTDAVPDAWLPEDAEATQGLYGERLPGRLSAEQAARGLTITLASQSHRVTAVSAGDDADAPSATELPLVPMAQLDALPIEGRPGAVGSFFYPSGPLRGHVRGAWNAFEGLTLFGWLSLDPSVGMDKAFGDPQVTGTPFYTQLPFWMHERSRLDRMDALLRALGYRLPEPDASPGPEESL